MFKESRRALRISVQVRGPSQALGSLRTDGGQSRQSFGELLGIEKRFRAARNRVHAAQFAILYLQEMFPIFQPGHAANGRAKQVWRLRTIQIRERDRFARHTIFRQGSRGASCDRHGGQKANHGEILAFLQNRIEEVPSG